MLLVFIIVIVGDRDLSFLYGKNSRIEESLRKRYEDYYDIYDYNVYDFKLFKVVKVYKDVTVKLPKFSGEDGSKFADCFEYCKKFSYNRNQPNPNLIKNNGGSCLALSLLFKAVCERNGIECELVLKDHHASNYVVIDDVKYDVDVTNNKIGGL